MKLLRLKITDPDGFRSLPCGFEHHFRTEWSLQDEQGQPDGFAPFVCAGPNGSGKSNLLEALAAISFQLELRRVQASFLPEVLQHKRINLEPAGFELDYRIKVRKEFCKRDGARWAQVHVWKDPGESVRFEWVNQAEFEVDDVGGVFKGGHADIVFPDYVLGYSSGENEILSLPFFKTRFVQLDEYWNALSRQLPYPGRPDARMAYLDSEFSQAILLCNLLFEDETTLQPFRENVGIEGLREFRIIIKRSIPLSPEQLAVFASEDESQRESLDDIVRRNPAVRSEVDEGGGTRYRLNLMQLLEADERLQKSLKTDAKQSAAKYENFDPAVTRLKRCATLSFVDDATDSLILDFWVNDATRRAFRENFDDSPLALFQAFQVLLTINLYAVSDKLKSDLYGSTSHYVSETVPTLASDQRIMRFKFVRFSKHGLARPVMLKELSDGEHQLLHSLGLCLLFRETNSLFLLDEPETHLNPEWRASFVSSLRACLQHRRDASQEMLITTHSPFLLSDSRKENVLIFSKDSVTGRVDVERPQYETLGASINKITVETFGRKATIGDHAGAVLAELVKSGRAASDLAGSIENIQIQIGDSIERTLAIDELLDLLESNNSEDTKN